jgi:two-component system, NarL family, response regulator DegU
MSINIVIADDHSMIREGLKQLLELDENIKVVAEAPDGLEAIKMVKEYKPNILLLDINMPVLNGIDTLKKIRKDKMKVKVLILTIHNEVEYLIKAVDIGCNGYIMKDSNSELLRKAIYSVYAGENFIQPTITPALNAGLAAKAKNNEKLAELTRREVDVLKYLAQGLFNREIAVKLDISERTVKNHVSNIFKKLQVNDRTQAALFAIRNDIVEI